MAKYNFLQIDAFTNVALGGNPCAVLFNTDQMSDNQMLAIAKEMNLLVFWTNRSTTFYSRARTLYG